MTAEVADEAVILHLKQGIYYGLNPVSASIWKLLQSPLSVRAIREAILEAYEVDEATCQRDLVVLLEELHSHGLIELHQSAPCANS